MSPFKNIFTILGSILVGSFFFTACNDDNDTPPSPTLSDNQYVNKWIKEEMNDWYYWTDEIPQNIDDNKSPDEYFNSLLKPYNTTTHDGDRYSWIRSNYAELINSLSGISRDIGFEYYTIYDDNDQFDFIAVVYVKIGSDAEKQGLKRGDIIEKVDGVTVTEDNNGSILRSGANGYTLTIKDKTEPITVQVMDNFAEYPIYYSKVLTVDNKKIGYLVYNGFMEDNGDESQQYDVDLAAKFTEFYNANVTDIVLDLRYNGGGYIRSAQRLASALVKNRSSKNLFARYEYNKKVMKELDESDYMNYFLDGFSTPNHRVTIPRLGDKINKVYILTGKYTASASEMLINSLKPYMDVVTIGRTTYGKNVGSISLYEEKDSRNKWGMQPIVLKTFNSKDESNYGGGFTPDYPFNEFSEPLLPFGDTNEALLKIAIDAITGQQMLRKLVSFTDNKQVVSSAQYRKGALDMFVDKDVLKARNK